MDSQLLKKFILAVHVLIFKQDKVLIIKRAQNEFYEPFKWELPGGKIEFGETPLEALLREVSEEVRIVVEVIDILYIYTDNNKLQDYSQHFQIVYSGIYVSGEIILQKSEHIEYRWININDLKSLPVIPYLDYYLKMKAN